MQHLKKKWIRYLFETLAIIIGILGAFSLDNWKQNRIDRKEEILILKEIRDELSTGMEEIEYSNSAGLQQQYALKLIINQMAHDLPYHDSLNQYFYNLSSYVLPEFPSSGFETLKSKGFGLVSNDELRRHLIDMFDRDLVSLKESLTYDSRLRAETYKTSAYIEHFTILSADLGDSVKDNPIEDQGTNPVIVPVDYNELIKDVVYENLLREIYNNNTWMVHIKKEALLNIKLLRAELDAELMRLQ